jgi:hypothetical protein
VNAYCVLAEDVDATSAAKVTVAIIEGQLNSGELTIGAGCTLLGVKAALRPFEILLRDAVSN